MDVPRRRILQVHPTRRCNLRCLHCYSSSGPEQREELDADVLEGALGDAAALGYDVASFSGGEPVLYPHLGRLLRHSRQCGLRTTVTSNGMLLDARHLDALKGHTDVLAISLDGIPASHNRMRAAPRAFEIMLSRLDSVRESGIPFGFIFTLTQFNLDELDWAARFALEQGARLFQIHPLEDVGRATHELAGSRPDDVEASYAYLESERIRKTYGDRMQIQFDLFHRGHLKQQLSGHYGDDATAPLEASLSDLVSPLVVEADGTIVPLAYGFGRRFVVGSLLSHRLRELAPTWVREQYPAFRRLCRDAYTEAMAPAALPFLNWHELVEARSMLPPGDGPS
jgi:MoaA/NifB/PqqE/SkfB family radical SAM enzyme